ncbi:hypothetical protein ABIC75_000302 [Dyella japonica]|uniref:Exopolysaccharide biosynthesis protein n=2 Tax=Dyella japonica TaxID=231455 RepID=A0ABV2JP51_9GAMM
MALVAAQLVMGRTRPWLPAALRNRQLGRSSAALVLRAIPVLQRLEKVVHPRAGWPTPAWMRVPVGTACFLLAIIVALPIPFGNMLPGLAVVLFSLGMMEKDGKALWLALAVAIAGLVLIALVSVGAYEGIQQARGHLSLTMNCVTVTDSPT